MSTMIRRSLREHYPEYGIEAFCLGMFMLSACLVTALVEHPASPVRRAVADATLRRALVGMAMGATAVALIYSPWGKRSGAHMNPSVTLAFLRLGRIRRADAFFYVLSQFIGGWLGVAASALILRAWIADPAVAYAVTLPGPAGVFAAWAAECGISFGLMGMVLILSDNARLARWTGIGAGILVAFYIVVEAPYSGMSMNPARTLGSAIPAGVFTQLWIYFTAPPLGMLAAAETYRLWARRAGCAKLIHDLRYRCLFCGHQGEQPS